MVNRWFLRVGRGYDTDISSTVLLTSNGSMTSTVLDLVELGLRKPGCENSSVYTEYYGFSVQVEVMNGEVRSISKYFYVEGVSLGI